jgi:type IV pilus assembly protein PilF
LQLHVVNWREKPQYNHIIITLLIFLASISCSCVPQHHAKLNSQTQLQLGLTYLHLHHYPFAEHYLNEAALSNTTRLSAQKTLAYLYQLTGRSVEANDLYQTLIKAHPTLAELHNNYGVFLCQQKQYQKAADEFNVAKAYDVENTFIQKNSHLCHLNASKK